MYLTLSLFFQVNITTKGIRLVAPSTKSQSESIILDIQHSEIVKVVVHFSKQLCVIFLYNKPSCARYISEQLFMTSQEGNCKISQKTHFLSVSLIMFYL